MTFGPKDNFIFISTVNSVYMMEVPVLLKLGNLEKEMEILKSNKGNIIKKYVKDNMSGIDRSRGEFESKRDYRERINRIDSIKSRKTESASKYINDRIDTISSAISDSLETKINVGISIGKYDADNELLDVRVPYPYGLKDASVHIPIDSAKQIVMNIRSKENPKAKVKYKYGNGIFKVENIEIQ